MAAKIFAKAQLWRSTDLNATNLVKIGQITNITLPEFTAQFEDSSDLETLHDTFEITSQGWGDLQATLNFDEGLAAHDAMLDETDVGVSKRLYEIVWPDNKAWDFVGALTNFAPQGGERTNLSKAQITIKVDGKPNRFATPQHP